MTEPTQVDPPYLLFLADITEPLAAKTAEGIARFRPERCVGQLRLPGCGVDVGLPDRTVEEAVRGGAKTLIVGVATRGGVLSESWIDTLAGSLEAGLNVASGLHRRLADTPRLAAAAAQAGRRLIDVRHPPAGIPVGTGERRRGLRLLTVGTDCSVGKMVTALAIEAELKRRDMKATFRATGQTGIFIAGAGISVDAVVGDFISGASELLSPPNEPDHWDIIEGQGSLFQPSYAGVSIGLLHGSQPDAMVMCHEAGRERVYGLPHFAVPSIAECITANEQAARRTNPTARVIGVSLNTRRMNDAEASAEIERVRHETGLPTADPLRQGMGSIVDALTRLS